MLQLRLMVPNLWLLPEMGVSMCHHHLLVTFVLSAPPEPTQIVPVLHEWYTTQLQIRVLRVVPLAPPELTLPVSVPLALPTIPPPTPVLPPVPLAPPELTQIVPVLLAPPTTILPIPVPHRHLVPIHRRHQNSRHDSIKHISRVQVMVMEQRHTSDIA